MEAEHELHGLRFWGVKLSGVRLASVPGFGLRIGKRATLIRAGESSAYGMIMELYHP